MADPFMSPRSYTYSGGDLFPYRERADFGSAPSVGASSAAPGVAVSTGPQSIPAQQGQGGGFLAGVERFAGAITPIVEAAAAFKHGYRTGMLPPGRFEGPRMGGQELIFRALEDMRARNERASEQARIDRESARQRDLKTQVLLKAYENKEISLGDLMRGIETGDMSGLGSTQTLPSQKPEEAPKPTPQG